jgi:hypothetical protein
MKKMIVAPILVLSFGVCRADDESDIVSGCAMSNAEFGTEMIQICIKENQAARAEVERYPDALKPIVERCKRRTEMGFAMVKKCIYYHIAAWQVLEAYARDHRPLLEH